MSMNINLLNSNNMCDIFLFYSNKKYIILRNNFAYLLAGKNGYTLDDEWKNIFKNFSDEALKASDKDISKIHQMLYNLKILDLELNEENKTQYVIFSTKKRYEYQEFLNHFNIYINEVYSNETKLEPLRVNFQKIHISNYNQMLATELIFDKMLAIDKLKLENYFDFGLKKLTQIYYCDYQAINMDVNFRDFEDKDFIKENSLKIFVQILQTCESPYNWVEKRENQKIYFYLFYRIITGIETTNKKFNKDYNGVFNYICWYIAKKMGKPPC